jgi:hypothetical protein
VYDLVQWLDSHIEWSQRTFGPGKRTEGLCKHIEKELVEIRNDPDDLFEYIDVVILALDGAWRHGYTSQEIASALWTKQEINSQRQWAKDIPEDQPSEHLKG